MKEYSYDGFGNRTNAQVTEAGQLYQQLYLTTATR
ncbi:hypothetical protein [Bacillus sp. 491mf]